LCLFNFGWLRRSEVCKECVIRSSVRKSYGDSKVFREKTDIQLVRGNKDYPAHSIFKKPLNNLIERLILKDQCRPQR